jgi:DeoR family transcriptional regulator, aga operon transcriptional repressor
VASLLGTRKGRVVVLGGSVLTDELACVGPVAAATVRRYHADLAVLGAAGLSARHGITELSDEAAEIQRLMIEHAERLVIVADGSKLGEVTMATVAPAERITTLITDDTAPTQELVELEALGVELVLVARSAPREKPVARRSREK